jgi:hypothetical protein
MQFFVFWNFMSWLLYVPGEETFAFILNPEITIREPPLELKTFTSDWAVIRTFPLPIRVTFDGTVIAVLII